MPTYQISITLPDDVRSVYEAEATRLGSTIAPLIRHTLVQLVQLQGWPQSPITARALPARPLAAAAAAPSPAAVATPPSPAAAPVLVDVAGRPRAPDAFDEGYEPPRPVPAVRRPVDPNAPPRWKYRPPT